MRMVDAARAYAGMGWAVLPLGARDKVPAIRGGSRSAVAEVDQVEAWWKAHPQHNVGVACGAASSGLIVVDVDVDESIGENGLETLYAWEAEHGKLPATVTARTGRGGLHLYFKAAGEVRNSANKELGVDVRGEGGYVMAPPSVHPNGHAYEWVLSPYDAAVAPVDSRVLEFLEYVKPRKASAVTEHVEKFELPGEIGAGGRNDTLFRYASSLQRRGFSDSEIRVQVEAANALRCRPPLPAADIETICSSVCGRYEKGAKTDGSVRFRKMGKNGKLTAQIAHNVVAHELIDEERCCIVDGAPAIWDGRRYAAGWFEINRAIIRLIDDAKMADRKEIRDYLLHSAPHVAAADARFIAFTNGVLDVSTMEMVPAEGEVITNVVPHEWDADASDAAVDRFLNSVSCNDAVVRANLEEVIGVCLYRSNEFGQCPVLVGAGSNGKSTFIHALRAVLGSENVSSLDLGVVGKQFQTVQLLGKLANLGDDISNERLSGDVLAVFKKVVTGEWVYTDVKNGEGFQFRPFCTLVFSCNEFPSLGDSSEGMLRRLFPVPFDARYSRTDADYDPRIVEKVTTDSACRYLVRLGVAGLRRVMANHGFTPNGRGEEIVADVRQDNDTVLQWIDDNSYSAGDLDGKTTKACFEEYAAWCREGNQKPYGRKMFTRRVKAALSLDNPSERTEFAHGMRNVHVFRRKSA